MERWIGGGGVREGEKELWLVCKMNEKFKIKKKLLTFLPNHCNKLILKGGKNALDTK